MHESFLSDIGTVQYLPMLSCRLTSRTAGSCTDTATTWTERTAHLSQSHLALLEAMGVLSFQAALPLPLTMPLLANVLPSHPLRSLCRSFLGAFPATGWRRWRQILLKGGSISESNTLCRLGGMYQGMSEPLLYLAKKPSRI